MTQRAPRPEGAPWITPYIVVTDVDAAMGFYNKAFGFSTKMAMPDENGATQFAEIQYKGQMMMLGKEKAFGNPADAPKTSNTMSPMSLYLYCEDVDAFYKNAVANGAMPISEPEDKFWGDRVCVLGGPSGYTWSFATNVGEFDPSKA